MVCTPEDLATYGSIFGRLPPVLLTHLANQCADMHFEDGQTILYEGGEQLIFILLEGSVKAIKSVNALPKEVTTLKAGQLFGTIAASLCIPSPLSWVSIGRSRVASLDFATFYAIAELAPELIPELQEISSNLYDLVKECVYSSARPRPVVLGYKGCPKCERILQFLARNQVNLTYIDAYRRDIITFALIGSTFSWIGDQPQESDIPAVQFRDGVTLKNPTLRELADHIGLKTIPSKSHYQCIVVGAGPCGMAAGIYAASEGLSTLIIEREAPGGQAQTSSRIENYLGFSHGISGDELAKRGREQLHHLGAELLIARSVEKLNQGPLAVQLDGEDVISADSIILATGALWKLLPASNANNFLGRGVFYGASHSNAALTHGKSVHFVGAGNSAGEAALDFASYASSVTLIVRGATLEGKMSAYLRERLKYVPNIKILYHTEVKSVLGKAVVERIELINSESGVVETVPSDGLYLYLGGTTDVSWLPKELLIDNQGFILTGDHIPRESLQDLSISPSEMETSIPGVFCCGDIRSSSLKRVASAVGEGSTAVINALNKIHSKRRQ